MTAADYEGPNSAFGAGRQAGQGVLDGIRAAINFRDTVGLSEKPKSEHRGCILAQHCS